MALFILLSIFVVVTIFAGLAIRRAKSGWIRWLLWGVFGFLVFFLIWMSFMMFSVGPTMKGM